MNTALIKRDLLDSLKADSEYRHAWNLANVYTGVCFQIRALREQRDWSQAALGKAAKMAPERISILEDPNADTKPTLNTLLRIANACDIGLDVRFVPYGTVIDRSTKTDLQGLEVPSFDEELPGLERSIEPEVLAATVGAASVAPQLTFYPQGSTLVTLQDWAHLCDQTPGTVGVIIRKAVAAPENVTNGAAVSASALFKQSSKGMLIGEMTQPTHKPAAGCLADMMPRQVEQIAA